MKSTDSIFAFIIFATSWFVLYLLGACFNSIRLLLLTEPNVHCVSLKLYIQNFCYSGRWSLISHSWMWAGLSDSLLTNRIRQKWWCVLYTESHVALWGFLVCSWLSHSGGNHEGIQAAQCNGLYGEDVRPSANSHIPGLPWKQILQPSQAFGSCGSLGPCLNCKFKRAPCQNPKQLSWFWVLS
jgi:hypothetical protein